MSDPLRADERLQDLRRAEKSMVKVRWIGVPWALLQISVYSSLPYPPGVQAAGFGLVALLFVGNIVIQLLHDKTRSLGQARALGLASLSLDVLVVSGIVWIFAFDPGSALWAVLFILPLEGAIRFQLGGALATWFGSTVLYTLRELWGSDRYGYELEWNSITFRMGIGLLIAAVAGLMARDLVRERRRLSEAFGELQRVDALRQGLISTLAHDVRNPLTVIRGVTGTLLSSGHEFDLATTRELLRSSDRQAERLQRLASDLLDLARLEEGKLHLALQPLELRDAVQDALSYADEQGRFEVKVPSGHWVLAEPQRLEQVIVNLVSNALTYGEPPFVIASEQNGTYVQVRFEDAGPGVPEDEQRHLFEPFRSEADRVSVGFGLAIVKALTEAQGGSVDYIPRERGACFRLRLPAPTASVAAAAEPSSAG